MTTVLLWIETVSVAAGVAGAVWACWCALSGRSILRAMRGDRRRSRAILAALLGVDDAIRFHLWDAERGMYWAPDGVGYVHDTDDAGRYTAATACELALRGSFGGLEHATVIVVAWPGSGDD